MTAYAIFIREQITDRAEMDEYARLAVVARNGHNITPLARYGACEGLEGPEPDGVVILAFDDLNAARAWYESSAYQEAKSHRLKGATYRVLLTEGVS